MPVNLKLGQPKTLEGAVDFIVGQMSDSEKKYVLTNGARQLHMTVGMALRNEWNLWGTQPDKPTWLFEHFKERFGLGMADDMSSLILEGVEARIQDRSPRYDEQVMKFKAHWQKQGRDPLTLDKKMTFTDRVMQFLGRG